MVLLPIENGFFELKLKVNYSFLEASFIGYEPFRILVDDVQAQNELVISLKVKSTILEGVTIHEKRNSTQLKIDRKIIHLGSDIQQAGVTALEAFDQIAEVETDNFTGTVSLRGSENVRILINGKPSSLSAAELLNQIPASSIDRIEIITSPSNKYQADGLSGIINIVLKRNQKLGLNSNLQATSGTQRQSLTLNGNYNFSSINFRLNASKSNKKETNNQSIHRDFKNGITENIFTPYDFVGRIYKISPGVDIYWKEKHELSLGIDYTDDEHDNFGKSYYHNVTGVDDYVYYRENSHAHRITIFDANYRLKIAEDEHFLELDYHINSSKNSYPISDFENFTFVSNQLLKEDFVLQSFAVDYTFPMKYKVQVETGISHNTQSLNSRDLFGLANSATTDNRFEYDEVVSGLYVLSKFRISKINLQTGLRYEHFETYSQFNASGRIRQQKFNNIFPSLHFSFSIGGSNLLNFGYARRISRPNFHHSNALQIVSPLFIWEYNPDIVPEISDNIELNYQRLGQKLTMGLSMFYRYRKNVILWKEFSRNGQQIFRYENAGIFNSYGIETTLKYKIATFWNTIISTNYFINKIDPRIDVTWNRTYSSRLQIKNTWDIGKNFSADLVYLFLPNRQAAFNKVESRNRIDLSLNGRFVKNKLSIGLRIVDVFDNNLIYKWSKTKNLMQLTIWDFQSQTLNFY